MKLGITIAFAMCLLGYLGAEGFIWPVKEISGPVLLSPLLSFTAWLAPDQPDTFTMELASKRITLVTLIVLGLCLHYFIKNKKKHGENLLFWLSPFLIPYLTFKFLWFVAMNAMWG